ncbi:hypothetical protein COJ87_02675 [Bacillus cereus]|uniref:hypothetical protein n=1 Tax=Bacillus cereus TaxID=1396 RepID=UPI000BF28C7F|nr:hypothetical protein [Bacillus cereus]PFO80779.1 hypothetical protein COJ87_02675 [Bacillus cereus]
MDFILNNWASILSVISFILSCFALYFNWQNTNINKEKFKNEQDDKKKATIVWNETNDSPNSLYGHKTIKISNTGNSDAKNLQIIINDKVLEKMQDSDFETEDFTFDGLKVVDTINNFIPTEINAGLSASFRVITNPLNHEFIIVKLIWDDEFEKKREKTLKYTPGNTKVAN